MKLKLKSSRKSHSQTAQLVDEHSSAPVAAQPSADELAQLEADYAALCRTCTVVALGSPGGGASTLVRLFRLLWSPPSDVAGLQSAFAPVIQCNTIDSMLVVLKTMGQLGVSFVGDEASKAAAAKHLQEEFVNPYMAPPTVEQWQAWEQAGLRPLYGLPPLSPEQRADVSTATSNLLSLIQDAGVRTAGGSLVSSQVWAMNDPPEYMFRHAARICAAVDYAPTIQDVIRSRQYSRLFDAAEFEAPDSSANDSSGTTSQQQQQRRVIVLEPGQRHSLLAKHTSDKWLRCFVERPAGTMKVTFSTSVVAYTQPAAQSGRTAMHDAIDQVQALCKRLYAPLFTATRAAENDGLLEFSHVPRAPPTGPPTLHIILTRMDLLRHRLCTKSLASVFPDFHQPHPSNFPPSTSAEVDALVQAANAFLAKLFATAAVSAGAPPLLVKVHLQAAILTAEVAQQLTSIALE
ncbi:hypothetical protein CAOG_02124 [Capsaspora owczarzaki ATCC 30864]|uniref:Uncharacterized protein n=1 Tax=Capsaspora owczarzaki (strain ATCC 30864) TaxID=595528 RepID=A0A0D2U6T8_CAPO3|nr:hypothetical protein CAOG_02124 [Capsaspora owczarzaki ATCC 30864]KJE90886.1 hypothetical protein CAOG_002124 [Capsaspora owczarzaki ATCC 30864]|eukprot:XP_004348874.1 hypothetical protein CAOG_02124 [Capsaspora owczarzaki ATCC 30864]